MKTSYKTHRNSQGKRSLCEWYVSRKKRWPKRYWHKCRSRHLRRRWRCKTTRRWWKFTAFRSRVNHGFIELQPEQDVPTVRLRLRKPKQCKKVQWTSNTVDNENMNKKKSKCCCIYEKPRKFGESSSDEDDECDHCHGHREKKKSSPEQGDEHADPEHVGDDPH